MERRGGGWWKGGKGVGGHNWKRGKLEMVADSGGVEGRGDGIRCQEEDTEGKKMRGAGWGGVAGQRSEGGGGVVGRVDNGTRRRRGTERRSGGAAAAARRRRRQRRRGDDNGSDGGATTAAAVQAEADLGDDGGGSGGGDGDSGGNPLGFLSAETESVVADGCFVGFEGQGRKKGDDALLLYGNGNHSWPVDMLRCT
ncbi:glycine-rich cell wall structural protein 1.8-like [Phoenix dactylifera]|uniref:Glycine-rich cell wall structural protein 1.8-like n=1 Tax=Phoenix dactylifera TaxID=42345 RepID=A0A8B8ZUQ7_PHODC|nr:glycine-rich cell wall structural protein 1.8-like [Phoenix dactylifera]